MLCVIQAVAWAATLPAGRGCALTGGQTNTIQAVDAVRKGAVAEGISLEQTMT